VEALHRSQIFDTMKIEKREKGTIVYIENVFSDKEGTAVKLDGNSKPDIEITNAQTENILVDTKMTKLSSTQFSYNWQTTEGMLRGEYIVEVAGPISNDTISNKERIRLEDVIQND